MFNIILVVLALVALAGCRGHRETVRHEEARFQRAVLDSTVTRVDTTSRRDSVSLSWVANGLSLEVDSVDYRITWDSVGRPARVSGKRLVSRRSSVAGQKAAATIQEETHEEARRQRTIQDSTAMEVVEDKRIETQAGWHPAWVEVMLTGVVAALAVVGALRLRKMIGRWWRRGH